MIISTKKGTPKIELEKIVDKFEAQGLDVTLISGKDYNVFGLVGDTTKIDERDVLANPWIDNVTRVSAPYKRANRLFHPEDSVIDCGGIKVGGKEKIVVMAGPCSIEGEEHSLRMAQAVKAGGASMFRGGAYKPRTSPYCFQGLETEGILDMVKAREATGLPIVSELMSEDRIPEFEEYVDVVQIGARNMQNFQLLKAVGKMHKPVLLKRGLANTIEEWIMSAEYIMAGGNEQVILCERGIRTFEKYTRNTLDLSAVPIIHEKTHLPIVVDPSHATGKANLVEPMMIAAVTAGHDVLGAHDPLLDGVAQTALEQHGLVHLAHGLEQLEVLHIACADLHHVHILFKLRDAVLAHQLGDDGQAGGFAGLYHVQDALGLQTLKGVGRGAGLVGAAAEQRCAARLDPLRDAQSLLGVFDAARARHNGDLFLAADLHAAAVDDRVCGVKQAVGALIGRGHAGNVVDPRVCQHVPLVNLGGVAHQTEHVVVLAGDEGHVQTLLLEFVNDLFQFVLRSPFFGGDDHGSLFLSCSDDCFPAGGKSDE